jgi:uracil-DNA glycosylase family 4
MNTREFRRRVQYSMTKDVRFKERTKGKIGDNPVLIVGQNPGRQRRGEQTNIVWEGNRSSDLLQWVIAGQDNIYLTNVCNYQEMTPERIEEGVYDLSVLISTLKPRVIICLGAFAHLAVAQLEMKYPIRKFLHPSYIARFNKDRDEYKRKILEAIKS